MNAYLSVQYCSRSSRKSGQEGGVPHPSMGCLTGFENVAVQLDCLFRIVSDQLLGLSALDDAEVYMSASDNVVSIERKFAPKSETSSICMSCFRTVRSTTPKALKRQEALHLAECLGPPLPIQP
jgi:hypothetical protein